MHAAREGVDITPGIEERSKLATVRQPDWLVDQPSMVGILRHYQAGVVLRIGRVAFGLLSGGVMPNRYPVACHGPALQPVLRRDHVIGCVRIIAGIGSDMPLLKRRRIG